MNLRTNLLPHQTQAIQKLAPIKIGALFAEMGTGKTRITIELIHQRQQKISNVIYFCPVSLKETVKHELKKHTDLKDTDIYLFNQKTNQRNIPQVFCYLIGIESMSLSNRIIFTVNNLINTKSFVIVDESSFIKGHNSKRTKFITSISEKAKYRIILTGTPISQGIVDLYAQFKFLSPRILGYSSFYSFAANHLEYSDKFKDMIIQSHNTEYIAAKIAPYTYQITKKECLNLPKKLYKEYYFDMTDQQRYWYDHTKSEILENIEEWDSYSIFQLFSRLQQIVCGFYNRKEFIFEHNRIQILQNIISAIPGNEKIIIWCKYEHDIHTITESIGINKVSQFYGKIKVKNRQKEINDFKQHKRFFVSTESCGGHGLTLNESNYTIFYNNGFKYSERMQAEDRNHRIGQTKSVTYIDIICRNSIDERIQNAISNKGNIVESFKNEVNLIKNNKNKIKRLIQSL